MFFKFFPSEIARLVLGYLKEAKCPQSWQNFLTESPDLQEYYRIYQEGEEYPTFVDGKSLIEILQEYRRLRDEVQRNTENQSPSRQAGASSSNPEVFKSPRKTVENPQVNYKVNQRAQSTITSIHYTQSREKLPRPSDNVTSTPNRVTTPKPSRRLQGVHVAHLNFGQDTETNANEGDEISRRLSGTTMRTPNRNTSTSWAFRATTPSRRTCQTDPARRKVNFFSRTPRTDPVAKSKDHRDAQAKQSNNNLQKEPISHLPEQENLHLNARPTEDPLKNQRLVLGSSEASTSGMQSSIINQSITLRTSEVTRSDDNITITTTKSSFTPQNEGEPPIYHRAPDTNSPRLVLSYDRSQISSLSTPMKDRRSWTEDFASPKRKGFIPRRRLMNESPNPKQVASNELSLGSLPELNFSFLEEFLNNPPLVQKIADNINKVIYNDEPTAPEGSIAAGFPSLQDIQGSEDIIKSVLARTEADPMFDQCLSLLSSNREWDEVNATQESSNLGNPDIGASGSILAKTPDDSVLNTPTQPTASSSRIEAMKDIQIDPTKDIQIDPTRNPSQNSEQENITEATITSQDNSSIINTNNVNNITANGNSSVTPVSITEGSIPASNTETQNQVIDSKQPDLNVPTPTRTLDVLDSCMSIIQPDPEGVVHDDEESAPVAISEPEFVMDIHDKTIKQVPIGTPCQHETQMAPDQTACGNTILNQITPTSAVQSQTVSLVSAPVQSSQNTNMTLIPALQNVGNMYSTLSPSPAVTQLPYSTLFIPTMGSNPFNLQSNFPCGFLVNSVSSGSNWYCSNMSNNVVMPVQNLPAIANNAPIQSMPVVNQSPIKFPHDYSPAKAFCENTAIQGENVGNFITIPAAVTEKQPKSIINKKKPKGLLKVAPSQIKKATNKKAKKKKKRRALFPTSAHETLEDIVSRDIGDFPVLSVPEPSPGKSDSLSAMELFNNITENKSPQSPLLKEILSRAKILAGRGSLSNSSHVRTLEFTSPNPKGNSSKVPPPRVGERRRLSPRLKQKAKCPCLSPSHDNKTQSKEKVSLTPLGGTPEKKSPQKSVSMAEAVLVAMEMAVQSKPLNSTKDCASKDEISVVKSRNKGNNLVKESQSKSPIKKGPVKEIDKFFPSNLTDSESDSELMPLSKLINKKPTIPIKDPITKTSNLSTPSAKEDLCIELDNSIEIIENSDNSLGNSSGLPNKRKMRPRKAKNRARFCCNEENSTTKAPQSSKNQSTLLKAFVSKSPRKVNRKGDSNSKKIPSKSAPRGDQCEEKEFFNIEETPSPSQKDCNSSNEVQLNKNHDSEIQISLKNPTQEQKEKSLQDKEITEGGSDELKVSDQSTDSKAFVSKSSRKVNRKVNSNSKKILSKSSPREEQHEEKEIVNAEEIPSTLQKDCNSSNEIQLNKNHDSKIPIQDQKEKFVPDKEMTEDAFDELKLPDQSTLSKAVVSKSSRKVNRKIDSNSKKILSKSSPSGEQCEEKEIVSVAEIPSTSQKDCHISNSNEVQLNKNHDSEIQIPLKNPTQEQEEKNLQDKVVTEVALDGLKVSEDLFLPEKTIIFLGKSNSNEITEESIGNEKERMVNSLNNNQLHPENSDIQKPNESDIASFKKAPVSDERICLDSTFSNDISTIHSSESGQSSASLKSTKPLNELNKNSPQSTKCRNDSPKNITKEPKKVPLTSAIASEPVSPHNSPKLVNRNSPQSMKHRNDSPKNVTKESQKVPLTSAIKNKPVLLSKSVNKNSLQNTKRRNDSSKNIVKDSHKDYVTLPSNENNNKSPKIPSSDKMANLISKDISKGYPTPASNLEKHESSIKPCTSLLSNNVTSSEASNESSKQSGYTVSKPQSLCSTVKEKEANSNTISSRPEIKITSSSDFDKLPPLPLKKILPPPKKRIRPIPVTSPNDGGFSPFSPFSSPAHVSTADISSNSMVNTPILANNSTNVSMSNKTIMVQPRMKLPSGKPKAMAEFYKAALPDRSNDLPISPGTVSNSSCTLDTFLARKMLTGSCAKNVVASNSSGVNESPKKKFSANNLKYLFTDKSNSFSPLKMPHNVLYPSAGSSLFACFNHSESTLTADENAVKSPLKKSPKNAIPMSQSAQQSNSENDDESSDEEGEIFSPVKTTISKADPVRISSFAFSAHLNPHKEVLPFKNKRKSSPMKAVAVNDCIIPSLSTVSYNQGNNVPSSIKQKGNISSEKTVVSADDQLLTASSMLPIQLSPAKDSVSYEEGLIISPVKAVACNDDKLTSLSTLSKKRKRSSSPGIGESHKKRIHLESQKRQGLSSNPKIEEPSVKPSLGNPESSGKLSEKSPVRSLVAFRDTKPKSWKQRTTEQNPKIPAGVKIPSKWDYSNISTYKTSIENQSPKEESRKEQISSKSKSRQRPSQRRAFQSPIKTHRVPSKTHGNFPSEFEAYKKSKISHSTNRFDRKQLYRSHKLEDYKFSYRSSPHKYQPNIIEHRRFKKSDNFTHKENEKSSRETPSKSNWSKASWNSGDKSIAHETEKDTEQSSKSKIPKDKHKQKDEDLSTKIISENPDHITDCDKRNIATLHKATSPKEKSDSPKVKRKHGNKSISKDICSTPLNREPTQKPIPHFEETKKIDFECNKSPRISEELKTSLPLASEGVIEPFTHKENEKSSRKTPSKSNWSKASWNSGDKSIAHETEKDTEQSSKSKIPKDKHKQTDEDLSTKIISENPDHITDCDKRNIVTLHKATSPKDKSDSPKVKRKHGNKSISKDIRSTPLNREPTQKPIPHFEETKKIDFECNKSPRLSEELKTSLPLASEGVIEPEHNFHGEIEVPKDTESRTSADQNELNEAVAFLTNDNDPEESQQECHTATSSAQAPLIDASSDVQPSGPKYIQEQDNILSPEKVLNSEAEGSKNETTGPATMDLAYLLQRINAVGGFEKLREVMRRK